MLPNLAILIKKCEEIGFSKDQIPMKGRKLCKNDCVAVLSASTMPAGGLLYEEVTPMLCFAEWNLKEAERKDIWTSQRWAAQKKLNGCRLEVHFVKGVGVFAHSRTISVKTWRFQELTDHLLFRNYVPDFTASIDAEVIVEKPIDTRAYTAKGEVTKTSLHSTTSLLHIEASASLEIQVKQDAPLMVQTFDITKWNGKSCKSVPLYARLTILGDFMKRIGEDFDEIGQYFLFPEMVIDDKRGFAKKVFAEGGEGVILKNLEHKYVDSASRPRKGWVKVKKKREHDAFVTGYQLGTEGKGYENLVGSLEFSVNLKGGGTHMIGRPTNLSLDLRKKITVMGADGKATLNPKVLGKVAEISGQDISARELRLSHCTIERWRNKGADAKDASDCIEDLEDLKKAASWVG